MTPRQPTTAQDGQNSPKSINSMPGAELDLVAIEEEYNIEFFHSLPDGFKKTASHIGTIAALIAEVKRLRYLIPIIEQNYALALDGVRKSQPTATDCPFCHHPTHADLGCRFNCSCKRHKEGKVGN